MGWHRLARKEFAPAAEWFKSAIEWSKDGRGDAKVAEGYAIALQNLGRFDEAERVAFDWASQSDAMRALYVDVLAGGLTQNPPHAMSADTLKRYAATVGLQRSANGAQALAWYSYNVGQFQPAAAWFEKALSWQPSEPSAVGLALTYRRMNDAAAFSHVIDLYRDAYPKVAELLNVSPLIVRGGPRRGGGGGGTAIYAAFKAKDYARCIGIADAQESLGHISASDSLMKGWCLMAMSRPQEASAAFDHALAAKGAKRDDAAYGKSLALLRSKSTDEAASTAQSANLSPQRRNEIGVEVLTQRAQAAFRANRFAETLALLDQRAAFAPEQRDLLMMRGWSLYHMKNYAAAKSVFTAVDRQLSSRDSQAGLGAVDIKMNPVRE